MGAKPKLLFVSHSATRNGATILLLHLLRWLKSRSDFEFEVLVNGRGELRDEFRDLCVTHTWRNPEIILASLPRNMRAKWVPRLGAQLLRNALRGRRYDLVHVNTAAVWRHLPILAQRNPCILWHIHELGYSLRSTMGGEAWRQMFPLAKRFIAVSRAVQETLTNDFCVPAEKIDLVHEFISVGARSAQEKESLRRKIRTELGLADDVFVVGGCGSLGWRKGTDLFLKTAQTMSKRDGGRCAFLWVGGDAKSEEALQFDHDIKVLGLRGSCKWIPNTADVSNYYFAMDAFALTSREDPFPLVMLEAGAAGLPIVCFDQSGGGPEFVGRTAGLVAPYLDTEVFAKQLAALQNDGELRKKLGTEASRRVAKNHSVETQAPLLLKVIEQCMQTK
jgi:glycosyltransferase involved in cell wall biosynthesis